MDSHFQFLHAEGETPIKGWIDGVWTESGEGRRVKAYTLTSAGRRQLRTEKANWRRVTLAMDQVLGEG